MMKKKYNPVKKFLIAAVVLITLAVLGVYCFSWYRVYEKEQIRESYLLKTNTLSMKVTNINDLNTVLSEVPSDYFIFIGFSNNKDEMKLEKKIKPIIDDYGLNDIFYYIDITSYMNNNNYLNTLSSSLSIPNIKITSVPSIIFVKDGKISKENILMNKRGIKIKDFQNLLKSNNFEKISQ